MASYLGGNNLHQSERPDFGIPRLGTMPVLQMDASFGSDMSLTEAVQHLQDLMRENQELKGTLRDNNDMMKAVQRVLVDMKANWDREKAESVKKFDQAKTVVMALRKDAELKKAKIEALERQNEQANPAAKISPAKKEMDALANELAECKINITQMKKERAAHNKEIENLRVKMEQSQSRTYDTSDDIKKLQELLSVKTEESENLGSKLSQLVQHNKKLAELKTKLSTEKEDLMTKINDLQAKLDQYEQNAPSTHQPLSLNGGLKHSFVMVEEASRAGGSETGSEDGRSEQRISLKYEGEQQPPSFGQDMKLSKDEICNLLKEERRKVAELSLKISDLNSALETSAYELQIKDASLCNLRSSLDGQMKILEDEHKKRQEELLFEIDTMQRHMQQSQSFHDPSQMDSIGNMKAQVMSLLHEVQESERRLEVSRGTAQKFQKKYEEIQQRYNAVQEELETQRSKDDHLIEALRTAVSSTEASLAVQKENNEKKSSIIQENILEIQELKKECSTLKCQVDELKKKSGGTTADGKVVMSVAQKRELDEKIDNLTARLISNEDTLMGKQEEIQKLQEKIILLRNESEDIPYLKAQIGSYKADFEKQRKLSERLHREKLAALDELDNLRLFNNQLREQLGHLSSAQYYSSKGSSSSHHGASHINWSSSSAERDRMRGRQYPSGGYDECDTTETQANTTGTTGDTSSRRPTEHSTSTGVSAFEQSAAIADEAMKKQYECPKCGLETQDIDSLTIHVDECLQQE